MLIPTTPARLVVALVIREKPNPEKPPMNTTNRSTPLIRGWFVAAIAIAAASCTFSPTAWADPDPHIPNGAVGWCPGGQPPGVIQYCLDEAFPDGTFYVTGRHVSAGQPFGGPQWDGYAWCASWVDGHVQGSPGPSGCGGGPGKIDI